MRLSHTHTATLAAALLALLALCQLATPVAAGRALLDKNSPSELEKQQLAAQEAELAKLVADGQAEHAQQAAGEAAKAQRAADEQAQREKEQLAAQQDELAEQAKREDAHESEMAALEKAARKAEKEARNGGDDGEDEQEKEKDGEDKQARREEGGSSDSNSNDSNNNDGNNNDGGSSRSGGSDGGSDGLPGGRKVGAGFEMDTPEVTRESGGGSGKIAYATYHYYAPLYETSSLYCADAFEKIDKKTLLTRPWTAYCNDKGLGPMSQDKCGKSLCVTNTATGQTVKMVVVDMCGQGGVDMDPLGFNAIDGNGAGVRDGHMDVTLRWC